MKECKKCKETKNEEDFPLDRARKDGRHTYCKICKTIEQKRRAHKQTDQKQASLVWTCHRCNETKTRDRFISRNARNSQYLCLDCKNKSVTKERERNKIASAVIYSDPVKRTRIKKRHKERRDARKLEWIIKLGGKCIGCALAPSTDMPVACFDFHHTDETKEHNLSSLIHAPKKNAALISAELIKCIVFCANCHRKHHHFESIDTYDRLLPVIE